MVERIRQWILGRISEPLIARTREWFRTGPVGAVALIGLAIDVAQAVVIVGLMAYLLQSEEIRGLVADMRMFSLLGLVGMVWFTALFVSPLKVFYDLMGVSKGKRDSLSPWVAGVASVHERTWKWVEVDLVLSALMSVTFVWTLSSVSVGASFFFLLRSLQAALWQNQRMHSLLVASSVPV